MGGSHIGRGAAALLLAAPLALGLAACGGAGGGGSSAGPATTRAAGPAMAAVPRPLPGLPADVAGFPRWSRLNARPIPPNSAQDRRVGVDAHSGVKNVYVNQPPARLFDANGRPRLPFPNGTIVVKAAREGGFVHLVAIMRKIQGVDPAHADWRWVEYHRDRAGAAFATDAISRGPTCWGCHGIARATDDLFTALPR